MTAETRPELTGKIALDLLIRRQPLSIDRIKVNRAGRDFAKSVHDMLVVLAGGGALIALHQLLGAFRNQKDQSKTVVNLIQAIFDSNTSHASLL